MERDDWRKCLETRDYLQRTVADFQPEVAIVLGSGLGRYGEQLDIEATIAYEGHPPLQAHQGGGSFREPAVWSGGRQKKSSASKAAITSTRVMPSMRWSFPFASCDPWAPKP